MKSREPRAVKATQEMTAIQLSFFQLKYKKKKK